MTTLLFLLLYIFVVTLLLIGVHKFEKENEEREKYAKMKKYFERRYKDGTYK